MLRRLLCRAKIRAIVARGVRARGSHVDLGGGGGGGGGLVDEILHLEGEARFLEASEQQRKDWLEEVGAFTESYLKGIKYSKAFNEETERKALEVWRHPICESPTPLSDVLSLFRDFVTSEGIRQCAEGNMGYMPGSGLFPSALGDYLAAVTNCMAGVAFASPGAVQVESQLVAWMCQMVGYDPTTAAGNLTSGGSLANLIGIAAARDSKGVRARSVESSAIYCTEQVHHSNLKVFKTLGLKDARVRSIAVDDDCRMRLDQLEAAIAEDKDEGFRPFLIVGTAGTTNTGTVDPLSDLADVCARENLWLHVDAAYGGFFLLCDQFRHKFAGIERADSVTVDPHKGLFVPFGTGAVLVKNGSKLLRSNAYDADASSYLQDAVEQETAVSPSDLSPELSKHFRGMRMWVPLKVFGVAPFRSALAEKILLCQYMWSELRDTPNVEVGPYPDLSVMLFRVLPRSGSDDDVEEHNRRFLEATHADGRVFFSSTTIHGKFWIRIAVLGFTTHLGSMRRALSIIKEKMEEVETQRRNRHNNEET